MGKTQIAIEYIHRYQPHYGTLWWKAASPGPDAGAGRHPDEARW
ncbi:hypothetical protein [Streptomyces mirabilis]